MGCEGLVLCVPCEYGGCSIVKSDLVGCFVARICVRRNTNVLLTDLEIVATLCLENLYLKSGGVVLNSLHEVAVHLAESEELLIVKVALLDHEVILIADYGGINDIECNLGLSCNRNRVLLGLGHVAKFECSCKSYVCIFIGKSYGNSTVLTDNDDLASGYPAYYNVSVVSAYKGKGILAGIAVGCLYGKVFFLVCNLLSVGLFNYCEVVESIAGNGSEIELIAVNGYKTSYITCVTKVCSVCSLDCVCICACAGVVGGGYSKIYLVLSDLEVVVTVVTSLKDGNALNGYEECLLTNEFLSLKAFSVLKKLGVVCRSYGSLIGINDRNACAYYLVCSVVVVLASAYANLHADLNAVKLVVSEVVYVVTAVSILKEEVISGPAVALLCDTCNDTLNCDKITVSCSSILSVCVDSHLRNYESVGESCCGAVSSGNCTCENVLNICLTSCGESCDNDCVLLARLGNEGDGLVVGCPCNSSGSTVELEGADKLEVSGCLIVVKEVNVDGLKIISCVLSYSSGGGGLIGLGLIRLVGCETGNDRANPRHISADPSLYVKHIAGRKGEEAHDDDKYET